MISIKDCVNNFPRLNNQQQVTNGVHSIVTGNYLSTTYLERIHKIELKETDVLLAGFARSGTTLARTLLLAIIYGGKKVLNNPTFNIDLLFPFIEFESAGQSVNNDNTYVGYNITINSQDAPHRLLKTHLPIWLAPNSTSAKKIIVVRDVKDTLISNYFLYKNDSTNPKEIYNAS